MTLNEMYKRSDFLEREYEKANQYIAQLEVELKIAREKAENIRCEWDSLDEEIERAEEEDDDEVFSAMPTARLLREHAEWMEIYFKLLKSEGENTEVDKEFTQTLKSIASEQLNTIEYYLFNSLEKEGE